jgi:segregation and condensation protein B
MAALAASSAAAGAELDADAEAELSASSSPARIESVLESVLFASDRPLPVNELKRLVGERAGAKVTAALETLRARRDQEGSGIQVVEVAGGWHLRTRADNQAWVSRLVAARPQRLTRAMLETLSIVAYRQPITRPEVDDVRGVDCGPVLKTLLDRGLVRMIGKKEEVGRPILYGTTPEFLRIFSLKDLAELPTLREFHELGAADMAKVDAEAPLAAEAAAQADQKDGEPAKPAARQLDPEEDDELLTELERAAAAAVKAAEATEVTTAPPPAEEAPPQATE